MCCQWNSRAQRLRETVEFSRSEDRCRNKTFEFGHCWFVLPSQICCFVAGIPSKLKFLKQNPKNEKHFKIIKNKIYFDLKGYIFKQLKSIGVNNIEIIKKDTFNPKNNFFSARRSLKKKINDYGRNISIIMIK